MLQEIIVGIKNSQIEPCPFGVNVPIGLTCKSVNASSDETEPFAPKKKSGKADFAKRGGAYFQTEFWRENFVYWAEPRTQTSLGGKFYS